MQARAISSSRSLIRLIDRNVRATSRLAVDLSSSSSSSKQLAGDQRKQFSTKSAHLVNLSAINTTSTNLMTNKMGFHSSPVLNAAPVQIKMPALSPTMTEGTIIKWNKKEGDKFSPGDTLFEVQTDKAVIPFELEEEGIIAKILVPENSDTIKVGQLVAIYVSPGDDWKNVQFDAAPAPTKSAPAPAPAASAPPAAAAQASPAGGVHHHDLGNRKMGPVARTLIREYNIDPDKLVGTGPHGFILKGDVKEYIAKNNLQPVPIEHAQAAPSQAVAPQEVSKPSASPSRAGGGMMHPEYEPDYEDIELSNMRKVIAKRLVMSKTTIPHSYVSSKCQIDKIVALRKEMIKAGQKVSINDFVLKALGLSLRLVPEFNSNMEANGEYKVLPTVDISIAVATDKGLITPIIKNADKLSVVQISEAAKSLAEKARLNKLLPHEFQGGSFSLSNLGMFGINNFSAVINPPQIAIMAIGKSQSKFNEDMKVVSEVHYTISYDERCVSLDRAMKFTNTFSYFISNPELLNEQGQTF